MSTYSAITGGYGERYTGSGAGRTHLITVRAELVELDREAKQQLAELLDKWRQCSDGAQVEELDVAIAEGATRVACIAAALRESE